MGASNEPSSVMRRSYYEALSKGEPYVSSEPYVGPCEMFQLGSKKSKKPTSFWGKLKRCALKLLKCSKKD